MRGAKAFRFANKGAVAIIFGLALIPIMLMLGVTVDYTNLASIRTRAQSAVDAAALAGVRAAAQTLQGGGTVAAAQTAGDAAAQAMFTNNMSGATTVSFAAGGSVTAGGATYAPSATLQAATSFMSLAGVPSLQFTVNATANTGGGKQYIDIYVLVDASQSMGIGASTTDQTNMNSDPKIGCVLACHNGSVNNPAFFDAVAYARSAGYQLRFDVVRNALNSIATQAQSTMASTGAVIRFGIYSFATNFKTEIGITSNYGNTSTSGSILYAINNMDIADNDAGTSLYYALNQLKPLIGPIGDGSSAASPQVFVLVMTDGVGNANDNQAPTPAQLAAGAAYNWTFSSTIYPAFDGTACWSTLPPGNGTAVNAPLSTPNNPPCVPDPYVAPSHTGNGQMELNGVDPSWCSPIKALDPRLTLMTLNTSYVLDNDPTDWRTSYIQQMLIPSIPGNLQNCASTPSNAFVANSAADIQTAVAAMFSQATKQVTPIALTK